MCILPLVLSSLVKNLKQIGPDLSIGMLLLLASNYTSYIFVHPTLGLAIQMVFCLLTQPIFQQLFHDYLMGDSKKPYRSPRRLYVLLIYQESYLIVEGYQVDQA